MTTKEAKVQIEELKSKGFGKLKGLSAFSLLSFPHEIYAYFSKISDLSETSIPKQNIQKLCNLFFTGTEKELILNYFLKNYNDSEDGISYINTIHEKLLSYPTDILKELILEKLTDGFAYGYLFGKLISGLSNFYSENKNNIIKGNLHTCKSSITDFIWRNNHKTKEVFSIIPEAEGSTYLEEMIICNRISSFKTNIITTKENNLPKEKFDLLCFYNANGGMNRFCLFNENNSYDLEKDSDLVFPLIKQVDQIINMLKKDGTAFFIVNKFTGFSKEFQPFRDFLIKNHYLKAIIDYNEKISYSWSQSLIYVLGKNSTSIKMIDATVLPEVTKKDLNECEEIDPSIVFSALEKDNENSITVSYDVFKPKSSLLPSSYIFNSEYQCPVSSLSDIVDVKRGSIKPVSSENLSDKDSIKFISQADTNSLLINLNSLKETTYDPKNTKYILPKGEHVIISRSGPQFKISLVEIDDKSPTTMVGPNLFYCSLKTSSSFDIYYLFSFFLSSKGQQSLRGISTGNAVPVLNIETLRSLVIPCARISEDNSEFKQKIKAIKKAKLAYEKAITDLEKTSEVFSTL